MLPAKWSNFLRASVSFSYTAHSWLTGGMPPCGCLCGGSCGACGGIPGMGWCGGWWWPGMAGCCMPPYMSPGPGGCCIMGWRSGPRSGTPRSPLSSSVRWSVWDTSWMCCIMLGSARRAWTFLKVRVTTKSHNRSRFNITGEQTSGPLFTKKTPSYQYRDSHYKPETVVRPS